MLWRPHQRDIYVSRKSLLSKPSKALIVVYHAKTGELRVSDKWISNGAWLVRRSAMSALAEKPQAGIKYTDMHTSLTAVVQSVERDSTEPLTVTDECYTHADDDGKVTTIRTLKRRTGTPVYTNDMYIRWFSQLHDITYLAGATREHPLRVVRDNETIAVFSPYILGPSTLSFKDAQRQKILPKDIIDQWKIDTVSLVRANKRVVRQSDPAKVYCVMEDEYIVVATTAKGVRYIVNYTDYTALSDLTMLELDALGLSC